jgi:hypothetical protein
MYEGMNPIASIIKNEKFRELMHTHVEAKKIGVIDFLNIGAAFKKNLQQIGFQNIRFLDSISWKKNAAACDKFFSENDFFIIVGLAAHADVFSRLNRHLLEQKKSWLKLELDEYGGVLGPVLGLKGGPCYDCVQEQLEDAAKKSKLSSLIQAEIVDYSKEYIPQPLLSLAALEVLKITTHIYRPGTYDGFYLFDLLNYRTEYHTLGPSPHCPTCRRV